MKKLTISMSDIQNLTPAFREWAHGNVTYAAPYRIEDRYQLSPDARAYLAQRVTDSRMLHVLKDEAQWMFKQAGDKGIKG